MELGVSRMCRRAREGVDTGYLSDPHGRRAIPGLANVQCSTNWVSYWTRMIDALFVIVGESLAAALVHTLSRHLVWC